MSCHIMIRRIGEQSLEGHPDSGEQADGFRRHQHPLALLAAHFVFDRRAGLLRAIQQHAGDRAKHNRQRQLNPHRHEDDRVRRANEPVGDGFVVEVHGKQRTASMAPAPGCSPSFRRSPQSSSPTPSSVRSVGR